MQRVDDFEQRRQHLKAKSDAELHTYFWSLAEQVVRPLVEEARTHTSPSLERSVLMRMGFSSIETKALVNKMLERGVLGHGAGHLVLKLAQANNISVRDAGLCLLRDECWEEVTV